MVLSAQPALPTTAETLTGEKETLTIIEGWNGSWWKVRLEQIYGLLTIPKFM